METIFCVKLTEAFKTNKYDSTSAALLEPSVKLCTRSTGEELEKSLGDIIYTAEKCSP